MMALSTDAHRSQRNYLRAEQRSIDVRKDNILLDVISETTTEMPEYTQKRCKHSSIGLPPW